MSLLEPEWVLLALRNHAHPRSGSLARGGIQEPRAHFLQPVPWVYLLLTCFAWEYHEKLPADEASGYSPGRDPPAAADAAFFSPLER